MVFKHPEVVFRTTPSISPLCIALLAHAYYEQVSVKKTSAQNSVE